MKNLSQTPIDCDANPIPSTEQSHITYKKGHFILKLCRG